MQFIQGVPEKMFLSEKGAYLTKGHFSGTPGIWRGQKQLILFVIQQIYI